MLHTHSRRTDITTRSRLVRHIHTPDIHLISERPPRCIHISIGLTDSLGAVSSDSQSYTRHTFQYRAAPAAYTFTSDPRNHSEPYRPTCTHHTTYSDIPHSRAAPRCIHIYVGRTEPLGAVPSDMHPSHTTDTFHSRAAHRCVHGSVGRTEPLGAVPSGTHSPPGDFRVPPQDPHTTDAPGSIRWSLPVGRLSSSF